MSTAIFRIAFTLCFLAVAFSPAASAEQTTGVLYPDFRDVADLSLRQAVLRLKQVDPTKYPPSVNLMFQNTIKMVDRLRIPEDGNRPLRVVFVDDMRTNMAFAKTTKGSQILVVHLGALQYFKNDDEFAYMLGHELEHALSRLNEEAREIRAEGQRGYWGELNGTLVNRVAENEVDAKSVFRRVHKKGFSPYASIDFIERMIQDYGDGASEDHTSLSNRRNTVELELVGMSRLLGEKRSQDYKHDTLSPEVTAYLNSPEFAETRRASVREVMHGYDALAHEFVESVRHLGEAEGVPAQVAAQKEARKTLQALHARYAEDMEVIASQLREVVPDSEALEETLRLQGTAGKALRTAIQSAFPDLDHFRNSRQYTVLREAMTLPFKNELTDWLQGSPLQSAMEDVQGVKEKLAEVEGQKNARAHSRAVTLRKSLQAAEEKLKYLLSGYADVQAAVETVSKVADILENGTAGSLIPVEVFDENARLREQQKHIGPEYKATEEWLAQGNVKAHSIYLKDPGFDPVELYASFDALHPSAKKQAFASILPGYLEHFQNAAKNAKSREEFLAAFEGGKEIFKYSYGHGWDIRDQLRADPSTAGLMRVFFRTMIFSAPDGEALDIVTPEIEQSRGSDPSIGYSDWKKTNPIQINTAAASMIYDEEMLKTELARRLQQFTADLRQAPIKDLADFHTKVEGFLKTAKGRIGLLSAASQVDILSQIKQSVLELALSQTPERIQHSLPHWREIVVGATQLRFQQDLPGGLCKAEVPTQTYIPVIRESLPIWTGDSDASRYLNRTLSLDAWVQAVRDTDTQRGERFDDVIASPGAFTNGRSVYSDATDRDRKLRDSLLEEAWSRKKVRDPRLDALCVLTTTRNFNTAELVALRLFSELAAERGRPRTVEDFDAIFRAMLKLFPTSIGSDLIKELPKQIGMNPAEMVNMITALRPVFYDSKPHLTKETIDRIVGEVSVELFDKQGVDPEKLPDLERARHLVLRALKNASTRWDGELDQLIEIGRHDPAVRAILMQPELVSQFYYEVTRRNFAVWQLQNRFQLDAIEASLSKGETPHPGTHERRAIVTEVQQWVDRQFPRNQPVKDTVLNIAEDKLVTSPAESQQLGISRLNFANWERLPEIVLVDLPDAVNGRIKSSFDRLELVEYFVGRRSELPTFIQEAEAEHRRQQLRYPILSEASPAETAVDLRQRFVTSPVVVRTAMLQALLDQDHGILAEPALKENLERLILGSYYDNKVFRTLFQVYAESLPAAERKPLYGLIVSSLADKKGTGGVSLKSILEAMGPFGIKAGQFLRTSGLLAEEHARELEDFLDRAMPPDRSRITQDLQQRFGDNLEHFEIIRSLEGSGSINYVVRVDLKVPLDGEKSVVVRVRRPRIEGQVFNENEIWTEVGRRMRSEDPEIAEVIEEARGHTYETLHPGGAELDLALEVRNEDAAGAVYNRKITSGHAEGFEVTVGHPLKGFQKLLVPGHEDGVAVYRFVDAVPLSEVQDPALREALAREIVESELRAVFAGGTFDPDGHPGNWLVDLKNKRLVRIDYAQLRTLNGRKDAFKMVFKELIAANPNFSSVPQSEAMAKLLRVDGVSEKDLAAAIRKVSAKLRYSTSRVPQQRLFDLRRAVRAELGVPVVSTDELRSGLAAIAKVRGFRRYLPGNEFEILIAKHAKMPMARTLLFAHSAKKWFDNMVSGVKEEMKPVHVPEPSEPLRPEVADSLRQSSTIARLEPPEYFANVATAPEKAAGPVIFDKDGVFELDTITNWSPGHKDELYRLTPDEFARLPLGTVLHSVFTPGETRIKGADNIDLETRQGRTGYGLRADTWNRHGGFEVRALNLTPPADLNLDGNPYFTGLAATRYTLLTPHQYDQLPNGTVVRDPRNGQGYIKGDGEIPRDEIDGHLLVGFPDSTQRGYNGVGTAACHKHFSYLGALSESAQAAAVSAGVTH